MYRLLFGGVGPRVGSKARPRTGSARELAIREHSPVTPNNLGVHVGLDRPYGIECARLSGRTTQPRGAIRMKVIRIGLDTSKYVFQIHGVDEDEQAGLRRSAVAKFFATLAPTRISIETCGASHHWARVLRGLGH